MVNRPAPAAPTVLAAGPTTGDGRSITPVVAVDGESHTTGYAPLEGVDAR